MMVTTKIRQSLLELLIFYAKGSEILSIRFHCDIPTAPDRLFGIGNSHDLTIWIMPCHTKRQRAPTATQFKQSGKWLSAALFHFHNL